MRSSPSPSLTQYPSLQPALPSRRLRKTLTARILQPSIVLGTVVVLGGCAVTGMVVAGVVFGARKGQREGNGMGMGMGMNGLATQGMVLVASITTLTYIILHIISSVSNNPIGTVRPPELRTHAACFITARLSLVFWLISIIASSISVSKQEVCERNKGGCRNDIMDVIVANIGFVATGIILTALEACQYPFQLPSIFHLSKKITRRLSSFGEDFMDRSISRASSLNTYRYRDFDPEGNKGVTRKESLIQKSLLKSPSISREVPIERSINPLLPMTVANKVARGWGEEWTHLVKDTRSGGLKKSDSAVSGMSRSSSGYISSDYGSGSDPSSSRRGRRSTMTPSSSISNGRRVRTVTPSSSISNLTKRSPLSTMRSAEFPDIVVRPALRYSPPTISAPHEWRLSRTASLPQFFPADVYYSQRRSSVSMPPSIMIQRPNRTLAPLAHQRRRVAPITRKRTIDIKVPGAYIDYRPSLDHEMKLEEHVKKIEVMAIARSESGHELKPRPPPKDVYRRTERKQMPQRIESKSRYREQRLVVRRAHTITGAKAMRPAAAKQVNTTKEKLRKVEAKAFTRLSLGVISPGLGIKFEL